MNIGRIVPAVDHRRAATPAGEPAPALYEHDRPVRPASVSHRRHAAALIRQLGGRTDAAVRRELDRLFAAPPRPQRRRPRRHRAGRGAVPQPAPPPPAEHTPRRRVRPGHGGHASRARRRTAPLRAGRRPAPRPGRTAPAPGSPDERISPLGCLTIRIPPMNPRGPMRCLPAPSRARCRGVPRLVLAMALHGRGGKTRLVRLSRLPSPPSIGGRSRPTIPTPGSTMSSAARPSGRSCRPAGLPGGQSRTPS